MYLFTDHYILLVIHFSLFTHQHLLFQRNEASRLYNSFALLASSSRFINVVVLASIL